MVVFGLLVFLIPISLVSQLPQVNVKLSVILAFLSVVYSGFRLSVLALDGREKLLSLTFWIFAYIWLGITPLVQLAAEEFPWSGIYSESTLALAAIVVLVGYAAYDLGGWVGQRSMGRASSVGATLGATLSKRKIYLLSVLSIPAAAFALVNLGGFEALFSARSLFSGTARETYGTAVSNVWFSLLRAPLLISFLLLLWVWINRRELSLRGVERLAVQISVPLMLVLTLMIANPISSARFLSGTVVLSLLFVVLRWNERRSMGMWIGGLTLTLLLIFPYADLFRNPDSNLTTQPIFSQLINNGDYDAFQAIVNTLEYVSANGITFGMQALGPLLFWFPRSWWEGKPVSSGEIVAEYMGYPYTNLSSPLWAEAYINLGILGVVVAIFAYGFLSNLLEQKYLSYKNQPLYLLNLLVPLLAAYQIYLLRGALIAAFAYLVPIVGYLLLAARRRRQSSSFLGSSGGRR